jgi:hypothetical protein
VEVALRTVTQRRHSYSPSTTQLKKGDVTSRDLVKHGYGNSLPLREKEDSRASTGRGHSLVPRIGDGCRPGGQKHGSFGSHLLKLNSCHIECFTLI